MSQSASDRLMKTRQCYCLAARKRARELTRRYEQALRPHGLRATQFSILAALAQTGPIPISQLAELLGLERTTLTRAVEVMSKHEWLTSKVDPADNRAHILSIDPPGRRKLMKALPDWNLVQDQIAKELTTK